MSLSLDSRQLKQLEMTRTRLAQLCNNIGNLKNIILKGNRGEGDPLPDPDALQKQINILVRNLEVMNKVLTENHPLFSRIVVHPSTNFPGRTQELVLQQLLRKKLEPELEDFVEQGRAAALAAGLDASKLGGGTIKAARDEDDDEDDDDYDGYRAQMDVDEDEDEDDGGRDPLSQMWKDAQHTFRNRVNYYREQEALDNYTAAERAMGVEKVRTGLRRDLTDSDDEDEDEDEDEDASGTVAAPAAAGGDVNAQADRAAAVSSLDPEYLMALSARGDVDLPANLRLELQRRAAAERGGHA